MSIYSEEFLRSHHQLLLSRLKIASFGMLVLYLFYLYVDFFLYWDLFATSFHTTLLLIHLTGFVASVLYLCVYYGMRHNERFYASNWPTCLANTYVTLYVASSALASLNSHRLVGTIEAYLIVLFAVPMILPIRPRHFFIILLLVHSLFLLGLGMFIDDPGLLVSKQIHTTLAVFLSFLIMVILYNGQRKSYQHHQQQKESEESVRKLFEINPFPLLLSRLQDGKIILVNNTALQQYPAIREQAIATDVRFVFHDWEERAKLVTQLQQSGSIKNFIIKQEGPSGSRRWMMVNYELIEFHNETCILSGITDITHLKTFEEELVQHASIDALTGLMNRRSGLAVLDKVLAQTYADGMACIVCFIDINNLKEVNDTHGHLAGDELITTVCQVIARHLSPDDLLFRYGGDEFIILFFEKPRSEVELIWERIRQSFAEMNQTGARPYALSASYGLFPCESGMSSDEVIRGADQEMYREKMKMKAAFGKLMI